MNRLEPKQVRLTLDGHLSRAVKAYRAYHGLKNIQEAILKILWRNPEIIVLDREIRDRSHREARAAAKLKMGART